MRLPVNIPNPAHSQFIARESGDPIDETQALSLAQARRLRTLPSGEDVLDYRDRAILDFYLYVGPRISTGCRLEVKDFTWEDFDPKIRINEKGDTRRTVGINPNAALSIRDYIQAAGLRSGPLFRARLNARSQRLGARAIAPTTMYYLLLAYLRQLPGALRDVELANGVIGQECIYSPHSLRATTATLLLDAREDIRKVQELLGHKHVTTTPNLRQAENFDARKRLPQRADLGPAKIPTWQNFW